MMSEICRNALKAPVGFSDEGQSHQTSFPGWMSRQRTDMTSTSKRNSSRESTNSTIENGDLELLEIREQRGRVERRTHGRVPAAAESCGVMGELAAFLY